VLAAVNSQLTVYDKNGNAQFTSSLDNFLGRPAGFRTYFDPKAVYDEMSQRFFVLAISVDDVNHVGVFTLAISQTNSATGSWWLYDFGNGNAGRAVDYEELGIGNRAVYLSGNWLQYAGWPMPTQNHSTTLYTIDKNALLQGAGVTFYVNNDLRGSDNSFPFTPKAAIMNQPGLSGHDGYVVAAGGVDGNPNLVRWHVWAITLPLNFPASGPTLGANSVDTDNPGPVPNATQLGGPARLQTNNLGSPPFIVTYRAGSLNMITAFPSGSTTMLRALEITTIVWPSIWIASQNDFTDGIHFHYWPSIAANAYGDRALVYSRSATDEFSNGRWSARLEDEGFFDGSQLLRQGDAYYGNPAVDTADSLFRWGDYAGAAVDPVNQGFWVYNMYSATPQQTWGSWIGYIPRPVFVDASYGGTEAGSRSRPWNSFNEGFNDALQENDLVLKAGTYSAGTTLWKPMMIFSDGGTATVNP
jgi:hypothetical protein